MYKGVLFLSNGLKTVRLQCFFRSSPDERTYYYYYYYCDITLLATVHTSVFILNTMHNIILYDFYL